MGPTEPRAQAAPALPAVSAPALPAVSAPCACLRSACLQVFIALSSVLQIMFSGGMFARPGTFVLSILALAPSLSSPREVPQVDRSGHPGVVSPQTGTRESVSQM